MASPGVADGEGGAGGVGGEAEEEEETRYGGDKLWHFCNGALEVHAFEDFMEAAIGGVVTKASVDLARWLVEACPEAHWRGLSCVELGAGCGLVSSALLKRGARVLATDMEPLLDHLQWNLSLNAEDASDYGVEALHWGQTEAELALGRSLGGAGAEAVLAANCVYAHDAVGPFLATVRALSTGATLALVCGVPVPPAVGSHQDLAMDSRVATRAEAERSLIDAFLDAAPGSFDCHLVDVPEGVAEARADPAVYPEGAASSLAQAHGLTAAALANGIWLLKLPGCAPPSWIEPLLTVPAKRG